MEINDYQSKAMETCMASCDNLSYMFMNLVGEVGEFASKVAKAIRKEQVAIGSGNCINKLCINNDLPEEEKKAFALGLIYEAGDVMWQLAGLCHVLGVSLDDVARMNLDKLAARKAAGTIDGSGDGIAGKERHA